MNTMIKIECAQIADKNECLNATSCIENTHCENTIGSFTCTCRTGFYGDPYTECIGKQKLVQSCQVQYIYILHV